MKQKSGPGKAPAEQVLKDIRRQTRRHYSAEEKFGKGAEHESRADLRDERGGATDPLNPPQKSRAGDIPQGRAPHADTDPRRPPPYVVDSEPEGLKRERKDPLSPTQGRR